MMSELLTEEELQHIRDCQEELYPDPDENNSRLLAIQDVGRLLAHIDAMNKRERYNAKALDELLLSEPLRYAWLADFRRR